MPDDSPQAEFIDRRERLAQVVDQLACPACLGRLLLEVAALVCTGCGRQYPIVDGIPTLIATISPEE